MNAPTKPWLADIDGDGTREVVLVSTGVGGSVALGLTGTDVTSFDRLVQDDGDSDVGFVADLNMDGYPDIVRSALDHVSAGTPSSVFVHWGTQDGVYGEPTVSHEGNDCLPKLVAEITGDSIPELIGTSGSGTIEVYHYDPGTGGLVLFRSLHVFGSQYHMAVADLDGDGVKDLVFAQSGSYSGSLRAWYPAQGPDAPIVTLSFFNEWVGEMAAADIDQNGLVDLFAGSSSGTGHSRFDVWLNQGGGQFEYHEEISLGGYFYDFELTDLEGDGVTDMVYSYDRSILCRRIFSDLTVALPETLAVFDAEIASLSIDDLNEDGYRDVLVIGKDARLSFAGGTDDPRIFDAPVQVFKWLRPIGGARCALQPAATGPVELALVTRDNVDFEVDLLEMERPDGIPFVHDVQMGDANWSYTNGARLIATDLDGDEDQDLFGCQSSGGPFNTCQLFAIATDGHELTEYCFGSALMDIQSYSCLENTRADLFDVTGDGRTDIIFDGNWDELGNPQTYFPAAQVLERIAPFDVYTTTAPLSPQAYFNHRDMDGDGDEDLLENNNADSEIIIRYNDGFGQFPATGSLPWDFGARGVLYQWVDVDGDGVDEACWVQLADGILRYWCQTLTPDSTGDEQLVFERAFPEEYSALQLIDSEGDGDADMLLKYRRTDGSYDWALEYHENTGDLMGGAGEVVFVDGWFDHLPMDVDADGDLDIVIQRYARLDLLRNTSLLPVDPETPPTTSGIFSIYPNPSVGDQFTIDLGYEPRSAVRVEMTDAIGRCVGRWTVSRGIEVITTTGLANGQYILRASELHTGTPIGIGRLTTFIPR